MASPENLPSANYTFTKLQRTSLQVFATTAMIGGWGLLVAYIVAYFFTSNQRFITLIIIEVILGLSLTLAWFLQYRGRPALAILVLYLSAFSLVGAFNFVVAGLGLTIGIVMALVFLAIAWQILPTRSALIVSVMTLIGSSAFYFIDTSLAPAGRLQAGFLLQELMIATGSLIFFILIINGLRGLEFNSISAQIRASFFVIALIPVVIITILQTLSLIDLLSTQANNKLLGTATILANQVDAQLRFNLIEIDEDAKFSEVVNFFTNPARDAALPAVYNRYENVLSYGLLDNDGFLLLDNRGKTNGDESQTIYFQKAAKDLETYVSDVLLDPTTGNSVYYVSAPVKDANGALIGVIRIKFDAQTLQEAAETTSTELGAGSSVALVDEANIVLAHSSAPEDLGKLLTMPDLQTFTNLQQAGRLPARESTDLKLDQLARELASPTATGVFTSSISSADAQQDRAVFVRTQVKPWKVLVAQHPGNFLAPALTQLFTLGMIMLLVMITVLFGANLTASLLANPVNQLAQAAQRLGEGDLGTSIHLTRKDELGTLSKALDDATRQTRELLQTLETRVTERTTELSLVNEKSQRRAAQLETISRVARAITSLSDPNQLLPEITKQISASFGYYHVGIFLLDENREYAVLRAANSEGGQNMLERGHRLKVGREGMVGNVTNSGQYRISLDVGEDAVFFNNPDLPNTRSEIALPLRIGDQIIGALDVQSTEPEAFGEDDIKTLTLLSDQISVAIENARLFDETRAALAQIQQTYSETSGTGWQAITSEIGTTGYRFVRGSLEPIQHKPDPGPAHGAQALEIPIMLRGDKLGSLSIRRTGPQQRWSDNEIRMYQSIVERMSFALENARLFSDARRRANLEKLASDATAKISSSAQFETILRTAAEEISRILDGSEVLVQIQPESIEQTDKSKS